MQICNNAQIHTELWGPNKVISSLRNFIKDTFLVCYKVLLLKIKQYNISSICMCLSLIKTTSIYSLYSYELNAHILSIIICFCFIPRLAAIIV